MGILAQRSGTFDVCLVLDARCCGLCGLSTHDVADPLEDCLFVVPKDGFDFVRDHVPNAVLAYLAQPAHAVVS